MKIHVNKNTNEISDTTKKNKVIIESPIKHKHIPIIITIELTIN